MIDDPLPQGIGRVALRELAVHGITCLGDVARRSEQQLRAIHGVGPKAIRILGEELAQRGQSFAAIR